MRLQIRDLEKVVSSVLEVFVQWPSRTKSDRLPKEERAKQKLLTKSGGHEWERLSAVRRGGRCNLCLATARVSTTA